jgi:hypothetical protein
MRPCGCLRLAADAVVVAVEVMATRLGGPLGDAGEINRDSRNQHDEETSEHSSFPSEMSRGLCGPR